MQQTFEANDAGFAYALGRKGRTSYDLHTADIQSSLDPEDDLEGIWDSGSYRLGTKRVGDRYVGADWVRLDRMGIQPDYFIDDRVSKWEWVDFVLDVWD